MGPWTVRRVSSGLIPVTDGGGAAGWILKNTATPTWDCFKDTMLQSQKPFKSLEQKHKQQLPDGREQEVCEGITCSEWKLKG